MTTDDNLKAYSFGYYILVDKEPVKCNDVALWLTKDRKIEKTKFGEVEVSTVFLGMSHGEQNGKPILFETLVFGGRHDSYMDRYTTWDDAVKGHKEVCDMVDKVSIERNNKLNDLGLGE